MVGLAAGLALGLGACGSTTTPHASSAPTAPPTTASAVPPPTTTATVPSTNAASTGAALDTQSVEDIDTELSGLQSLLGETASDIAAGKADN
jgi:hypothetical protein